MKLFRLLSVLIIGLFITSCAGPLNNNKQPSSYIKHLGSSTVALVHYMPDDREQFVFCSGVWIQQDEFLTAAHCIKGEARRNFKEQNKDQEDSDSPFGFSLEPEVLDLEGVPVHYVLENEVEGIGKEPSAVHLAKTIKVDVERDLALIRAVGSAIPAHDVADIAETSPAISEPVEIVGHPQGGYWTYLPGTVAAYREGYPDLSKKGPFTEINCAAYFGNSGGGAFDKDGKLMGIAINLSGKPQIVIFVHIDSIHKFLTAEKPNLKILQE